MDSGQSQRTDRVLIQPREALSSLHSTLVGSRTSTDAVFESMDGGRHVIAKTVQIQLHVFSVTMNVHAVFRGHILKICYI